MLETLTCKLFWCNLVIKLFICNLASLAYPADIDTGIFFFLKTIWILPVFAPDVTEK